jgi:hypothetical protein
MKQAVMKVKSKKEKGEKIRFKEVDGKEYEAEVIESMENVVISIIRAV